ncbi:hypothetical protein [Sphingobacterium deserti]|uniref:Uncharacterized protein n=1 Tax=Sphingobacterium deserti TaxID=1229276 RepID=A0A0B8TBB8_9SPHI|nr:hypothetical protein [Sphingobacterium deserti]KGE16164.1 hypothetical protein DI53_0279 [Sphingobacterium deserti]
MSNIGKLLMMLGIVIGFIYLSQINGESIIFGNAKDLTALYLLVSVPVFTLGLYFYFKGKRLLS